MSYQTVHIEVPLPLFQRLQRVAQNTHRSIEDVLSTTVNVALPPDPDLPLELADQLAAMNMFSDQALWAATASAFSPTQQRRLEQLTDSGDERQLTAAESAELTQLLEVYDYAVLRRAHALALLAHRGYELPDRTALTGLWGDEPKNP